MIARSTILERLARQILLVVLVGLAAGCMVHFERRRGEQQIDKTQIEKIQPGKTTRAEILQWFGPPLAIARKGTSEGTAPADAARAETFFELFAAKHALNEHHIVYYYVSSEGRATDAVVLFGGISHGEVSFDRLWILIDTRSWIVQDYVFRPQ